MPSTIIDPSVRVTTMINVFTVRRERQHDLVDLLNPAPEEVIRHRPGFVSASIHASADGERVVNYAQWTDVDSFRAMLKHPAAQEQMNAANELAESADPRLYVVKSTTRHA